MPPRGIAPRTQLSKKGGLGLEPRLKPFYYKPQGLVLSNYTTRPITKFNKLVSY